jgi:RimJ/RimL family protein N-acetyltransferase
MQITTPRLILIPSELPMARAELYDRPAFARLLDAQVPTNWPPESAADALPWFLERLEADAANLGWLAWYALRTGGELEERTLIGGIGFKGRPTVEGTVDVGYSVLPQFHGQGYAGEMLGGILPWAFQCPEVVRVVADTMPTNTPSVRLLLRHGFRKVGSGSEEGSLLFEKQRPNQTPAESGARV